MSETQSSRHTGRSIAALFVGFVAVVVLSIGTDLVLHKSGIFLPPGQPMSNALFALATVYRTVYAILGSYITARLAPNRPMGHALLGGVVGLVLSTVGTVATWNRGAEFGPHWYPISLIITALPCAWVGGKLYIMQARGRTTA
jgi:drug/metabolite transporter (DMT)-like permease